MVYEVQNKVEIVKMGLMKGSWSQKVGRGKKMGLMKPNFAWVWSDQILENA